MKALKKTLSLVLVACLVASIACVAAVSASANADDLQHRKLITDVVNSEDKVETNTYYFYVPESWKNEFNDYYHYDNEKKDFSNAAGGNFAAGIYWWEGPYDCKSNKGDLNDWPGYAVTETAEGQPNIYKAEVPKDAGQFLWNNLVDGGGDDQKDKPWYSAAWQTENIRNDYYTPGSDGYGFYPNWPEARDEQGNVIVDDFGDPVYKGFDGMIYVCNPKATTENALSHRLQFSGAWFYYYGNGEYGIYETREEAAAKDAIYKDGEFPAYGLQVNPTEVNMKVGDSDNTITPNDSTAKATVEDPSIVSITQDATTGVVKLKALKVGTTKVTFTLEKDNGVEKAESVVKVEAKPSIKDASISGIKNKTYNGKAQTQSITVKYKGTQLYNSLDYKVSYKNNKNAGTASITITGLEDYAGSSVTKTFKIDKAKNPMKVSASGKTYKVKALKKKAQSFKAIKVSKNQGKVTYKVTKKNKKLTFKNGKVTVKKKTKKGTYKITVQVTAAGNKNYKKSGTVKKTITVKVKK